VNAGIIKKIILIILIAAALAVFYYLDLSQFLTLEYIKKSKIKFNDLYSAYPFTVIGIYMLVYILVTSLSLPGAAVMTLAGGAFFGLWSGTLAVSFASSIGATIACFFSRFLLGNWVQTKFGERLDTINNGLHKEGSFYLFTLRLIPVFPFFMINLLMGLTKFPLVKFYWISQIGMLPGTIVYVNAGKELGKIESTSGILSPTLIISFIILGLFPLTVKKAMALYKKKYRPETLE